MNLPNFLTILRLAFAPAIVALLLVETADSGSALRWYAGALFTLTALTDLADGALARRLDQHTALGTLLDPVADKVLIAAVMLGLTATGDIAGWTLVPVLAILGREFLISGLREHAAHIGGSVPVSGLAKWKTAVQMAAMAWLVVVPVDFADVGFVGPAALWVAGALTLITGYDYLVGWRRREQDANDE